MAVDNKTRLKEMLAILGRHNIARGLTPEKLRLILTDLGPTYVKLGQILSMRPDMIPQNYCDELTKLRSEVAPMGMDEVRRVIESSTGTTIEELFASFDPKPLGSASIAQAHAATLKDGSRVVAKVQREGIHDVMAQDIALLRKAGGILKLAAGSGEVVDFDMVLSEMWVVSQEEMNFMTEAANAEQFRALNAEVAFVSCPRVYREYTTSRLLVMEYVDGLAIDDNASLEAAGYDLKEIGAKLADNYIKQIITDGFFHADPHPGNLRVREGKIVFIDMGMMGRLSARDQALLGEGIAAVARRDANGVKEVLLTMGKCAGRIDHAQLYTDVDDMLARYGSAELGGLDMAQAIEDVMNLAKAHRISMPAGVTMLARGLATVEGVIAKLSPEIDIVSITAARVSGELWGKLDWQKELKRRERAVFDSCVKSLDIPALVSDAFKNALRGQAKINVDFRAGEEAARLAHRLLNKLLVCLVLSALLLGGSILLAANPPPHAFGVSVAGLLSYLGAAGLAVWLARHMRNTGD